MAEADRQQDLIRIGGVVTDYGSAMLPDGARWTGGWDSRGLPIKRADGSTDVVPWVPRPNPPRWEWFGEWER
jgi:hypothetical protein